MFASPPLPRARGPLSAATLAFLAGRSSRLPDGIDVPGSVLADEDVQLALYCTYELHYRGFDVRVDHEWDPKLLAFRQLLEARFEAELRDLVPSRWTSDDTSPEAELHAVIDAGTGPSVSSFVEQCGQLWHFREFAVHRSLYQLKEADPHSWAIPRLGGDPKAAIVEIQSDEYGGGRAERMHATLFGNTMRALGLDDRYGALVNRVPAVVLAVSNTMSLFGLHRRLLGAIVGHLAALEMTSSLPNRLYGNGLRRLGFGPDATLFFDEHVQADAVHEQIAGRDLAGELARQQPDLYDDILFGAAACLAVEDLAGDHILKCWAAGRSSLRAA